MKKTKEISIFTLLIIFLIFAFLFSIIFSLINISNSNIFKGISINDINIEGLAKEEATKKIKEITEEKINKEIKGVFEDYNVDINLSSIDIQYDISKAIDDAYGYGRTEGIFKNNYKTLNALINKKNIKLNVTINENNLNKIIDKISAELPNKLIQSTYYIEDNNLIITKGKTGNVVDTDKFKEIIYDILNDFENDQEEINIPVINKVSDDIDIEKIYNEVCKEPKDAYYENDPFKVYSEIVGIDFDKEKAKKIISENQEKDEFCISLKCTEPKVKVADLDINVFKDKLGVFSTRYDSSNKNRSTNLKLAAKKINGTIISPGEEFSYNKVVGERSIEKGYQEAKVYEGGKVVDGVGGGICQISTTLYNAVMFANLDVTQRYNHQFITSYVEPGRDATVVYGVKDFKFKNNRTYPVKIVANVDNGVAKIEILGIKEENEYEVNFDIETVSNIRYKTTYEYDASLAEGEDVVKQAGVTGTIVNSYKIVKKNGEIISKELISKDTYNAMERVVLTSDKNKK